MQKSPSDDLNRAFPGSTSTFTCERTAKKSAQDRAYKHLDYCR